MRVFIPATDAKTVPSVTRQVYATGQTFLKGAVLGANASGELEEFASGGATIAANTVVGVALENAGSAPGYNVANDNLVVWRTGAEQKVSYVDLRKNRQQIFSGLLTDGTGVVQTPTQALVDESRGLIRLASGIWTVNAADTTNDAVQIVGFVIPDGGQDPYVLFRFLDSIISIGANIS